MTAGGESHVPGEVEAHGAFVSRGQVGARSDIASVQRESRRGEPGWMGGSRKARQYRLIELYGRGGSTPQKCEGLVACHMFC